MCCWGYRRYFLPKYHLRDTWYRILKEHLCVDEGKLWEEVGRKPIVIDFGTRKESWPCDQRWGVERYSTLVCG